MRIRKVETQREYNYGYTERRPEQDIMDDLINSHNELVEYIAKRDELVESSWGNEWEVPDEEDSDSV